MTTRLSRLPILAFDHAWRGVFDERATARRISSALAPLFGIRWGKKIILSVYSRPINRRAIHLMLWVRNSPISRVDYDRSDGLFKIAFIAPVEVVPEWEE